eukprot:2029315-Pleurochrysis_carterae.AAC.1
MHGGRIVLDDVQCLLVYTLSTPPASVDGPAHKRRVCVRSTSDRPMKCVVTHHPHHGNGGQLHLLVSGAGQGKTLVSVLTAMRYVLCAHVFDAVREKVIAFSSSSSSSQQLQQQN